jgi:hypothetical protein
MRALSKDAEFMISPTGPVSQIMNLLGDPRAARFSLGRQMKKLETSADKCTAQASQIEKLFTDWLTFAENLQKAGHQTKSKMPHLSRTATN